MACPRRHFLTRTALALGAAALPGPFPASAQDETIRASIEAHRPSRLTSLPSDFRTRVGATHVAGKYHFTGKPFLIEGAERLIQLGTRLGKFWFMPAGGAQDYPFNSAWPRCKNFTELARTDYWEQIFALPFQTIVLEAQLHLENGWKDAKSPQFYERITAEFEELTAHLYGRFRSRELTVVLQHWEGDWLLRGRAGEMWSASPSADWPKRCEQMARWLAARQAGVAKARSVHAAGAKCRVLHAAEVNRVLDGWKGIPTMTAKVLPQVELDLVSYSYYDAMSSPVTLWKAIEEIRRWARTNGPFGKGAIYLGEVGIPENEQPNRLRERWDEFLGVALAMKLPYVIHWELFCNELNPKIKPAPQPPVKNNHDVRGFFLVKPDGTLSESGRYLSELWQRSG